MLLTSLSWLDLDLVLQLVHAFHDTQWTCLTRALAEDDNSEECAILCESGARPGVYGLLVKCCAMSLFERS